MHETTASSCPRSPESTLFYSVVAQNLETFLALRQERARDNGVLKGKCGSVTFVQRFGSAANLHLHFHSIVFDGVYACAEEGETPRFYPLRPPDARDVAAVAARVAERVAKLMEKRDGAAEQEEPAMADLYTASITRRQATCEFEEESFVNHGSRCAVVSGYSVHAGVSIRADDRKGLERLLSYAARPPIAVDRLAQLPDGRLSYRLKAPWKNGTTHVIFEPLEFLARLAVLVPAPRVNLTRLYVELHITDFAVRVCPGKRVVAKPSISILAWTEWSLSGFAVPGLGSSATSYLQIPE